jgi:putative SOS response-associated peptidase YedK
MCGRYVRKSDKQKIAAHFAVHGPVLLDFGPSWNVAPQTFQPIVRLNRDTGEREIVLMRWGLVPYWAKEPSIGLRTINAKAETITTAPAFREAIKYRRCLVPADAFYEWQKLDKRARQPFAIAMSDGEPYAFAGLWEKWKDRTAGIDLLTFTVITTDPNEVIQPMHNRMPVIIPERDYERWLQPGQPDRPPVDLLRPYDAGKMKAWKVGKEVGNVKNDTPELLTPDNVVEMQKPPLTNQEIIDLMDRDDAGEFDAIIARKLRRLELKQQKNDPKPKPEDPNLSFDF